MSEPAFNPWRHRFAVLSALATFALIGVGGLVTSHEAGLAVPDWPTTYGYNMFLFAPSKWVGGVFYEHSHRLAASAVGLFTTILAIWMFGRRARPYLRWSGAALLLFGLVYLVRGDDRYHSGASLAVVGALGLLASCFWPKCEPASPQLRWLGVLAFFGVVLQGVLGGLRVVWLKDQIGIFHGALAQAFLVLICVIVVLTGWRWQALSDRVPLLAGQRVFRWLVPSATALIFLQLVLGATMRHQHAGLAIPDFPLAYHKLWPALDPDSIASYNAHRVETVVTNPITAFQVVLQLVHRLMALAIFIAVAGIAWTARRRLGKQHLLSKLTLVWFAVILVQVVLGASTVWSNKAADIATLHVLGGAMALVLGSVLTMICLRVLIPGRAAARISSGQTPAAFATGSPAASGAK